MKISNKILGLYHCKEHVIVCTHLSCVSIADFCWRNCYSFFTMKMQASLALSTLGDVTLIEMILIANAIWASIFMPQMPFRQAFSCRKCHSGKHFCAANAILASIFMPQMPYRRAFSCHKCHSGKHFSAANAILASIFMPQNSQQFQQQTSLM